MHIGRALYYGSYKSPRVLPYAIGVIILVVMMATAFLGCENGPTWFNFNSPESQDAVLYKAEGSTAPVFLLKCNIKEKLDKFIKENNINPVLIYDNLGSDEVRKQILSDVKDLSGI